MADRPDDKELETRLGYHFLNRNLLRVALTHPSANEDAGKREANARLEFLGDAVLGLVVAEMLYARRPRLDEGQMTEARKSFVANKRLRRLAMKLGVDRCLYLGRAELNDGGRGKPKRCGDALEALIGAIHVEAGPAHASNFVRRLLERYDVIENTAPP